MIHGIATTMALAGLDEDDEKAHKQVESGNRSFVCEGYLARGGYLLEISGEGAPIITQGCARLQIISLMQKTKCNHNKRLSRLPTQRRECNKNRRDWSIEGLIMAH